MAKKTNPMVIDNLKKLLRSVSKLELKSVLVGVPAAKTERDDGAMNNATIGYIMEHGSPAANIPARPHLAPGIEEAMPKAQKYLMQAGKLVLEGASQDMVDRQLHLAGLTAQNSVRAKINSGLSPELSPRTVYARMRRGRTGTKPLVDTGQYRNSITYVITDEKE